MVLIAKLETELDKEIAWGLRDYFGCGSQETVTGVVLLL